MANYYRVSPKFWIKARQRGWTDAQTTLALYVLTCEHRNLEGLYRLPKPYVAADLGWPARKVDEALAAVCASGLAEYDEDAEMILIPKALKHQSPSTDNHIRGAVAQLKRIPRTSLWDGFVVACRCHCKKLADAIEMEWPSHGDGISRVRAGAPAPAAVSSSNSISSSNPPLAPPNKFGGEPVIPAISSPGKPNPRATGTNPRAIGRQHVHAVTANAAAVLDSPSDEERQAWEQLHGLLARSVEGGAGAVHVMDAYLAGLDGEVFVIDAPTTAWAWLVARADRALPACCDRLGVRARLASDAEHDGLQRVAA